MKIRITQNIKVIGNISGRNTPEIVDKQYRLHFVFLFNLGWFDGILLIFLIHT